MSAAEHRKAMIAQGRCADCAVLIGEPPQPKACAECRDKRNGRERDRTLARSGGAMTFDRREAFERTRGNW